MAVRQRTNQLLYTIPGMTKKKLCEACGISGIGLLNKFLDNKGLSCAESSCCKLINILDQATESAVKRRRRLQCELKHGMGLGNRAEAGRWSADKLARFNAAFPGIKVEYGDGWWQAAK